MIELRPGDIFCTENPMMLGRAINAVQAFWAPDSKAQYSHAGIITSVVGETFEGLWTIRHATLAAYAGKQMIIGRNSGMGLNAYARGMGAVKRYEGRWYPVWRLVFHLIPPLAKYITNGRNPVCSELAARFLYGCGMLEYWTGVNPDNLADMIHYWKAWDVVYEGVWK
ncbi:MAG: hypothetical protein RBQ87_01220 [Candidatus Cloacimonadaceae bacterium]|nr:hypothetical protein [Candidatus Cloacimonadaceae bacterium]